MRWHTTMKRTRRYRIDGAAAQESEAVHEVHARFCSNNKKKKKAGHQRSGSDVSETTGRCSAAHREGEVAVGRRMAEESGRFCSRSCLCHQSISGAVLRSKIDCSKESFRGFAMWSRDSEGSGMTTGHREAQEALFLQRLVGAV